MVDTKSPLDIKETKKRYGLDHEMTEQLRAFDAFVWQDIEIHSINDLVAYENQYQAYCKLFGYVYDTEIGEMCHLEMEDGPLGLICRGRFQEMAKGFDEAEYNQPFRDAGLTDLEIIVLRSFLADISELYRLDAYYFDVPPFTMSLCGILNTGVSKLPTYSEWLVRKCHEHDKIDFVVGDVFSPGYMLTTSADHTFAGKSDNKYLIKPLNDGKTKARAIFKIKDNSEQQVTFLQDAQFRITAINDWGKEYKEIVMEEYMDSVSDDEKV